MKDLFDLAKFKNAIKNRKGRLMSIDFGTYKVGIAMTDESRILASPFHIYIRKNFEYDIEYFAKLIFDNKVAGIIIGAALRDDGEIWNLRMFKKIYKFIDEIINRPIIFNFHIPFCFYDESYSSHTTNEYLYECGFNKNQIANREDKIAATIILEGALNDISCIQ